MTLGEFRKITDALSDDTVFVDKRGEEKRYWITVAKEYARCQSTGKVEAVYESIFLDEELCD